MGKNVGFTLLKIFVGLSITAILFIQMFIYISIKFYPNSYCYPLDPTEIETYDFITSDNLGNIIVVGRPLFNEEESILLKYTSNGTLILNMTILGNFKTGVVDSNNNFVAIMNYHEFTSTGYEARSTLHIIAPNGTIVRSRTFLEEISLLTIDSEDRIYVAANQRYVHPSIPITTTLYSNPMSSLISIYIFSQTLESNEYIVIDGDGEETPKGITVDESGAISLLMSTTSKNLLVDNNTFPETSILRLSVNRTIDWVKEVATDSYLVGEVNAKLIYTRWDNVSKILILEGLDEFGNSIFKYSRSSTEGVSNATISDGGLYIFNSHKIEKVDEGIVYSSTLAEIRSFESISGNLVINGRTSSSELISNPVGSDEIDGESDDFILSVKINGEENWGAFLPSRINHATFCWT